MNNKKKSLFVLILVSFIVIHSTSEMIKIWTSPSFIWWGTESCHPNIPQAAWHMPVLHITYFIFVTVTIALILKNKPQKEVK